MNGVGLIDISELEGEQTHKAQMQEIWLLLIYCSDIFPHKPPAYPLSQTLGKYREVLQLASGERLKSHVNPCNCCPFP